MAKFRLVSAHIIRHSGHNTDVWLPGDMENEHLGAEMGTIVGDGTPYPVVSATLMMVPLDKGGDAMIADEEQRLANNRASMNPVDQLPTSVGEPRDDYDERYIPGFAGVQRPKGKRAP